MIENLAAGVESFTSNAFLVDGERRVLVDTGANFDAVGPIDSRDGGLDAVVLTHTHPDHVGNLDAIVDAFDVTVWGFDQSNPGVDHRLADDEWLTIGDAEYVALHTPGHADDHLCLYSPDASVLFAGDLVFQGGSFGRTDLAGGDRPTLVASLDRVLDRVDDSLDVLHAGHGPSIESSPYEHIERARQVADGADQASNAR